MNKDSAEKICLLPLAPAVILVILFMVIPTFNVFRYSLYGKTGIVGDAPFVGLNNFKILFTDSRFIESMQNMILIIVMVTLFTVVLAVLFATLLTREEFKGKNFFRVIFYIPNILSIVVTAGIFSAIYAPDNGLLNSFLEMIGLGMLQKQWMGDSGIILYSIIFALVWQAIGYYMVMYMASMSSIPENLYDRRTLSEGRKGKAVLHDHITADLEQYPNDTDLLRYFHDQSKLHVHSDQYEWRSWK